MNPTVGAGVAVLSQVVREARVSLGEDESLVVGRDGWAIWFKTDWHDVRVRIVDAGGRLVVGALSISAPETALENASRRAISASDLREVQLGRLESILNTPDVGASVRTAMIGGGVFDPCSASYQEAKVIASDVPEELDPVSLALDIPTSWDKGDDFYRQVAVVYARASALSNTPAVAIAKENRERGVESSHVHRWLKEARRRGLVPPTRRSPRGERSAASR